MIDEDFIPDRIQLRALGQLLLRAQLYPLAPSLNESELYRAVYEGSLNPDKRQDWLVELASFDLVKVVGSNPMTAMRIDDLNADVCLTPSGTFYSIARASSFAENAWAPTDDFPTEIVDAPWALQSYYAPTEMTPIKDELVQFDRDAVKYAQALSAIDAAMEALAADNEIGSSEPIVRDDMLEEMRKIRSALEEKSGWRSKIVAASWGAFGYVATHFADRPVGQLADDAWAAIQAIL